MKNSMKLNVLSLVVALSAAQAEAGIKDLLPSFGKRTPAPKLLPVAPVVTPSAPTSKWDMVTTAASTFGGTIATGAKSVATGTKAFAGKVATKAGAAKAATSAFVKANATKLAAAPLKTKVAVGLGAAVVAGGVGYVGYKAYKAYTKPSDKAKTPVKSEKQAEAKPGFLAGLKAKAVAAKDALFGKAKDSKASGATDASKPATKSGAKQVKAAPTKAELSAQYHALISKKGYAPNSPEWKADAEVQALVKALQA